MNIGDTVLMGAFKIKTNVVGMDSNGLYSCVQDSEGHLHLVSNSILAPFDQEREDWIMNACKAVDKYPEINQHVDQSYSIRKTIEIIYDDVVNKDKFDPNEIVVGSVWECTDDSGYRDYWTVGKEYEVVSFLNSQYTPQAIDDEGDLNGYSNEHWLKYFKRVK